LFALRQSSSKASAQVSPRTAYKAALEKGGEYKL